MSGMVMMGLDEATAKMYALYGENRKITDGNYDRSLGVTGANMWRKPGFWKEKRNSTWASF